MRIGAVGGCPCLLPLDSCRYCRLCRGSRRCRSCFVGRGRWLMCPVGSLSLEGLGGDSVLRVGGLCICLIELFGRWWWIFSSRTMLTLHGDPRFRYQHKSNCVIRRSYTNRSRRRRWSRRSSLDVYRVPCLIELDNDRIRQGLFRAGMVGHLLT
jgi:hypothetical protein